MNGSFAVATCLDLRELALRWSAVDRGQISDPRQRELVLAVAAERALFGTARAAIVS